MPQTLNSVPHDNARQEESMHQPGMGEAQKVSITGSPRLRLFALLINVLVIAELCVAMYFAQQVPEQITPIFFKVLFSLLVPTIILAAVGRRLIAKAER